MWICVLIVLGIFNGMSEANFLCDRTASQACLLGDEDFEIFPENEEELKDICNFFKTTLQCAIDFVDTCGKKNFDLFHSNYPKVEKLMDAVADICRPDSQLYARIVEVLPCTRSILRNDEELCEGRTKEALFNLDRTMSSNKNGKDKRNHLHQLYECLQPALMANCFLVETTNDCGLRARGTVLDILRRVGLLETECIESNRDEALQLLEIVQFLTQEEIYVKQLL